MCLSVPFIFSGFMDRIVSGKGPLGWTPGDWDTLSQCGKQCQAHAENTGSGVVHLSLAKPMIKAAGLC